MHYALLFDIDGCVTLPTSPKDPRSVLDIKLLDQLHLLQIPLAFITGRSSAFLELQFLKAQRPQYHNFKVYLEFGLVYWHNSTIELVNPPLSFHTEKEIFLQKLQEEANAANIYFESDHPYVDYPDHGSMWVEKKYAMLSIAGGPKVHPTVVQELSAIAYEKSKVESELLFHHLGIDFIPKNWSKEQAVKDFVKRNTLNEKQYEWYVFGDNESDRTMTYPLTNFTFIHTHAASATVWETLQKLKILSKL